MPKGEVQKSKENMDKFVSLYISGVYRIDIQKDLGIAQATYYCWLNDEYVKAEIERLRSEIKDEGIRFIKSRYKKYLAQIDKLANDETDRRTCLAANLFMIEKLDGKNTARIDINDISNSDKVIKDDEILSDLE